MTEHVLSPVREEKGWGRRRGEERRRRGCCALMIEETKRLREKRQQRIWCWIIGVLKCEAEFKSWWETFTVWALWVTVQQHGKRAAEFCKSWSGRREEATRGSCGREVTKTWRAVSKLVREKEERRWLKEKYRWLACRLLCSLKERELSGML